MDLASFVQGKERKVSTFVQTLRAQWTDGKFLCVGLDPDKNRIFPGQRNVPVRQAHAKVWPYIHRTIESTVAIAAAYKPNLGFFLDYGMGAGGELLEQTAERISVVAPNTPIILDGKFGDIGNTSAAYARFAFEELNVDAVTVNPYLGQTAVQPFLDYADRGVIVLCRTSNPGADEFQCLSVDAGDGLANLYRHIARHVCEKWNVHKNCAFVVGATTPDELGYVRRIVGDDMPILVPGIGTQGGDLQAVLEAGLTRHGDGLLINASSGIMFASDPAAAAIELHTAIERHRAARTFRAR